MNAYTYDPLVAIQKSGGSHTKPSFSEETKALDVALDDSFKSLVSAISATTSLSTSAPAAPILSGNSGTLVAPQ